MNDTTEADPDFRPHRGVHCPWTFICGADPDDSVVSFAEHPPAHIASVLLEDIGDWHHAIHGLQRTEVPPPVVAALDQLHEAVCGWADWTAAKRAAEDAAPDRPLTPPRPA